MDETNTKQNIKFPISNRNRRPRSGEYPDDTSNPNYPLKEDSTYYRRAGLFYRLFSREVRFCESH